MVAMAGLAGSEAAASRAILDFLRTALVDEDHVRFDSVLLDKDVVLDLKDIGKLVDWLVEVYSERPTVSA